MNHGSLLRRKISIITISKLLNLNMLYYFNPIPRQEYFMFGNKIFGIINSNNVYVGITISPSCSINKAKTSLSEVVYG